MDHDQQDIAQPTESEPVRDRPEPHEPPRLIELGSFADLTQGAVGASFDAIEQTS